MPRQRIAGKARAAALTAEQEMELIIGPGADGTAFASEQERRAAWRYHAGTIAPQLAPGVVAWAADQYDTGRGGTRG